MNYQCRRCGRTFSSLKDSLPEHAFEPPADAKIDPIIAADVAAVRGMTGLAKREIPAGETAQPGWYLAMIDGVLHEFKS